MLKIYKDALESVFPIEIRRLNSAWEEHLKNSIESLDAYIMLDFADLVACEGVEKAVRYAIQSPSAGQAEMMFCIIRYASQLTPCAFPFSTFPCK